jgi:hypothetical protein
MKNTHGGQRTGAGQKPKYSEPTQRVSLRMPQSIHHQIALYAKANGLTLSEAIIQKLS